MLGRINRELSKLDPMVFPRDPIGPTPASAPRLIHATGAYDEAAIAAEVARRMEGREDWQADMIEARVRDEASKQRWPIYERTLAAEWTADERAEHTRLHDAAHAQSISYRGNETMSSLYAQADAIRAAVEARARAKVDAPATHLSIAAE